MGFLVKGPGRGPRVGATEADPEAEADLDGEAEPAVVQSGQEPWDLVQWWWSQVEVAEGRVVGGGRVGAVVGGAVVPVVGGAVGAVVGGAVVVVVGGAVVVVVGGAVVVVVVGGTVGAVVGGAVVVVTGK